MRSGAKACVYGYCDFISLHSPLRCLGTPHGRYAHSAFYSRKPPFLLQILLCFCTFSATYIYCNICHTTNANIIRSRFYFFYFLLRRFYFDGHLLKKINLSQIATFLFLFYFHQLHNVSPASGGGSLTLSNVPISQQHFQSITDFRLLFSVRLCYIQQSSPTGT